MGSKALSYYAQQLARLSALMSGHGGHWGAQLTAARPRIAAMERIHRTARRDVVPDTFEKENM